MNAYLGQYLSEAVQSIFSVANDEPVQWQKMAAPYSGKISQKEHSKLRELYKVRLYHRRYLMICYWILSRLRGFKSLSMDRFGNVLRGSWKGRVLVLMSGLCNVD